MIPLLPPLVEFLDPQGLCRYSGASKTLRNDVRDTKAWELLAKAQLPRKTRDVASDALAQVQSHVRRRLLADAMALETQQTFRPNQTEDFSFFVRFEEDRRLIWEGDLRCDPTMYGFLDGYFRFDFCPIWDAIKRAKSWIGMERLLTQSTDWDIEVEEEAATLEYLRRCKITIVAIRDQDEAMVSLGHFIFDDAKDFISAVHADKAYDFRSRTPLFSSARFNLRMMASLEAVHNAEGHGGLDVLVLRLAHYSPEYVRNRLESEGEIGTCDESQFAHVLSYLAGIHHLARESALATIENWHVEAMAFSQYD